MWLEKVQASEDPLYFSVIDKASGKAAGRQTFMRIEPAHGRIEIGHIHWGPAIARKPAGTEAHYLFMRHAFEDLGCRRWEWKCDNCNEPASRWRALIALNSPTVKPKRLATFSRNCSSC